MLSPTVTHNSRNRSKISGSATDVPLMTFPGTMVPTLIPKKSPVKCLKPAAGNKSQQNYIKPDLSTLTVSQ